MQKIGLSFLGTGNYQETTYKLGDKTSKTEYFPKAFVSFFNLDKLYLVVTEEAKNKHWEKFQKDCKFANIEIIDIPSGKSEEELWKIFEVITERIDNNSELYIDITHSFRSIPILILPILLFLKATKHITIKKIVYGAFEAKENGTTPVFDLTYFTEMTDWVFAVSIFTDYGKAKLIKDKIIDSHNNTYRNNEDYKSHKLQTFGKKIGELADAQSLNRIKQSLAVSFEIKSLFDNKEFKEDLEKVQVVKPVNKIFDLIENRIEAFSAENLGIGSQKGIDAQCNLLDFYIETEQYVQAITLMRELVITKFCAEFNLEATKRDNREKLEKYLGWLTHKPKTTNENLSELYDLWNHITDLRNDIDHAGMRKDSIGAEKGVKNIKELKDRTIEFVKKDMDNQIKSDFENYEQY